MSLEEKYIDIVKNYTSDDFLIRSTPFHTLCRLMESDKFAGEQFKILIQNRAKDSDIKISNAQFQNLLIQFFRGGKQECKFVQLMGAPKLLCDGYNIYDFGVFVSNDKGENVVICNHPILPKTRLTNLDTDIEKMVLTYRRSENMPWRDVTVEKSVLSNPNSITQLANRGIDVTSVNSKELVKYLADMDNKNYDVIEQKNSISRLGYIDGAGFSPYVNDLVFDGDENYRTIFNSVRDSGNYDKWLDLAHSIRSNGSVTARIILAASFASALVKPCGALPFFVHLWGVDSGTGKTVALMLAASVWGNPQPGYYIQTFNSTVVGQEKLAAFLNNLPLCIDELQLNNKNDFDVYKLSEGVGRTRGTKTGGIEKTPTWANAIITTGESPITTVGVGAGAVNRVIDIECKADEKVIADGHATAEILRANYGYAGRIFAEKLYGKFGNTNTDMVEVVKIQFKEFLEDFGKENTTDKQAMSAALIATADAFATNWIFKDRRNLEVEDITEFLKTKSEVSAGERGYEYLCDWISENENQFNSSTRTVENGKTYGRITDDGYCYIINSRFDAVCAEGGFNAKGLKSFLMHRGLLETNKSGTFTCKIRGQGRSLKIKYDINLYDDGENSFDDF